MHVLSAFICVYLRFIYYGSAMKLLAIDIGTSSVRTAILTGPARSIASASVVFETSHEDDRAEVDVQQIAASLIKAIKKLGKRVKAVDLIAHATMSPSWLAMDKNGRAITPVVTHQDRRSIEDARWIESAVGKEKHLKISGNRPIPGGISSTTWRWFNRKYAPLMKKASLVGHLGTWLTYELTGERFTDPSNAGFMGIYQTTTLGGWSAELYQAAGGFEDQLPIVIDSNIIAGGVTQEAAHRFGLKIGTPVLAGCMDGSAAMLSAGCKPGQLLNVSGSTDVLALLVDHPKPHEKLLTRPLGIGKKWLAVSTLAAAGTAINWIHRTLFSEMPDKAFYRLLDQLDFKGSNDLIFKPELAGSRTEIESLTGSITGLRLATSREDILRALGQGLAAMSSERLTLLKKQYGKILPSVAVAGGISPSVTSLLRKDWKLAGRLRFDQIENATINGLWKLAEIAK